MPTREVVAYYRVSTKAQGMYGLGMEAQRDAVAAYAKRNDCQIVATYGEVETGRRERLRNRDAAMAEQSRVWCRSSR